MDAKFQWVSTVTFELLDEQSAHNPIALNASRFSAYSYIHT